MRKILVVDGVGDELSRDIGLRPVGDRLSKAMGLRSGQVEVADLMDLPNSTNHAGVVWDGSPKRITEPVEEWRHRARALAKRLDEQEIPQFGICWGAQHLAEALGGTAGVAPESEFGFVQVEWTDRSDSALKGMPRNTFWSPTFHNDRVVDLPKGGESWARTDVHDNQLGRLSSHALFAQVHVEMIRQEVCRLAEWVHAHNPEAFDRNQVIASLQHRPHPSRTQVLRNFAHSALTR